MCLFVATDMFLLCRYLEMAVNSRSVYFFPVFQGSCSNTLVLLQYSFIYNKWISSRWETKNRKGRIQSLHPPWFHRSDHSLFGDDAKLRRSTCTYVIFTILLSLPLLIFSPALCSQTRMIYYLLLERETFHKRQVNHSSENFNLQIFRRERGLTGIHQMLIGSWFLNLFNFDSLQSSPNIRTSSHFRKVY